MKNRLFPKRIPNLIGGRERPAVSGKLFDKLSPVDSRLLCRAAESGTQDAKSAVDAAEKAHGPWSETPPIARGKKLYDIVTAMRLHSKEIVRVVSFDTGKSHRDALAEVDAAIDLGLFFAGEGQRLYCSNRTSSVPNKRIVTVRQSVGVAALIIPANTPMANIAWKVFPALICGNAAVLKASEDAPATAWIFGRIAGEAGLAPGVLNIVQGYGEDAGAPLVRDSRVGLISFTGSTETGCRIAIEAGRRLAKVSLELGGKNPLVVCDDADLENALRCSVLSAFSNAGQRCASASRIIIFDSVYNKFRAMMVKRTKRLKVGPSDNDDLGPVINEQHLDNMLSIVKAAGKKGARILTGGYRLRDSRHRRGYYMAPTIIEDAGPHDSISTEELFGPVTCLYRAKGFDEALAMANDSPYGLTASIHTRSMNRAMCFVEKVQAGTAIVNGPTYGSEPHLPFGGVKRSGNGWREPGPEALDFYSNLKTVSAYLT